ncbi:hypothetical protein PHLCEN_2v1203 [Hermanssonia centrifuga]|uniref:Large ribosomal subunit protein mL59 domain-containing protein n=1 Tax=Hermanssonia centrifuga TaxID=98765 RepID=A0A2R6S3X5_9APHY|nr:hypothetical protein PHLCEN_2v1203 [Hermanssonia centrifuga]
MASQAIKQFRTREITGFLKANPKTSGKAVKVHNPFLPRLNTETGRWAPAKYSRRRQADLIKKARESNMLHLIPPGPKLGVKELESAIQGHAPAAAAFVTDAVQTAAESLRRKDRWTASIEWEGEVKEKKVPGADIGNRLYAGKKRMFKGHKWQRTMKKTKHRRWLLLRSMKGRISRFKSYRLIRVDVPPETSKSSCSSKDHDEGCQTPLLEMQIPIVFLFFTTANYTPNIHFV